MTALTVTSPSPIAARADVYQLIDDWLAHLDLRADAGELSRTTRATYKDGVDRFINWVDGKETVSEDTILKWKSDLLKNGYKPNSVNTWISSLRAFFAWSINARRLSYNPAANVSGAKRKGTGQRHLRDELTDPEVIRLLSLPFPDSPIGKRDRAMIYLVAYTGARQIEAHRANVENLQTQSGRLILKVIGKGHTELDALKVIAHRDAQHALYDWLAVRGDTPGALFTSYSDRSIGDRLSLRSIRGIFKHYYKLAGINSPKKTTHSLRHSAISSAARHGARPSKLQSMSDHASITTTMIYVHETDRVENPAEALIEYER